MIFAKWCWLGGRVFCMAFFYLCVVKCLLMHFRLTLGVSALEILFYVTLHCSDTSHSEIFGWSCSWCGDRHSSVVKQLQVIRHVCRWVSFIFYNRTGCLKKKTSPFPMAAAQLIGYTKLGVTVCCAQARFMGQLSVIRAQENIFLCRMSFAIHFDWDGSMFVQGTCWFRLQYIHSTCRWQQFHVHVGLVGQYICDVWSFKWQYV